MDINNCITLSKKINSRAPSDAYINILKLESLRTPSDSAKNQKSLDELVEALNKEYKYYLSREMFFFCRYTKSSIDDFDKVYFLEENSKKFEEAFDSHIKTIADLPLKNSYKVNYLKEFYNYFKQYDFDLSTLKSLIDEITPKVKKEEVIKNLNALFSVLPIIPVILYTVNSISLENSFILVLLLLVASNIFKFLKYDHRIDLTEKVRCMFFAILFAILSVFSLQNTKVESTGKITKIYPVINDLKVVKIDKSYKLTEDNFKYGNYEIYCENGNPFIVYSK